jgi:putative membrane protein
MKTLKYLILSTLIIWGMQACNNPRNKDAVSIAKKANESKDTTKYIDTRGVGTEEFPAVATLPYSDADFVVDATDRCILEIQLGKISLTNSSNPNVKDFGQMMINDYTKTNNELMAIGKLKDFVLPPSPSQRNIKRIKNLNDKTGKEFDKHYINFMISNHKSTISLFENASKNSTDVDIKTFADNTLPILRKHLAAAEVVKDKL